MLSADPHLPQRDVVWSRTRMREILDRDVLPVLRPGARVLDLHRAYTAYKAGKECLVLYAVRTEDDGEAWQVTVTHAPRDRLRTLFSRHYAGPRRPGGRRALLLDGTCLVEPFPNDWKLRDLHAAADPRVASRILGGSRDGLRIECLRFRPRRRCVLRYRTADEGRPRGDPAGADARDAVVKVYHDADKAAEVRSKLRELGPQAAIRGLNIPRQRGSSENLAVVPMEVAAGENLADLLDATSTRREALPLVQLAARALAGFHALTPQTRASRRFEDEIGWLRLRSQRLAEVSPALERRVLDLVNRIEGRLAAARSEPLRSIHGDYKPSQLLVAGERPSLVDLDRACLGDPAIDLGNFLAVLMKDVLLSGASHLGDTAPAFLAAYGEHVEQPVDERSARLFEAFALTRMLVRKLERAAHGLIREGSAWRPLALLDEAEACLKRL